MHTLTQALIRPALQHRQHVLSKVRQRQQLLCSIHLSYPRDLGLLQPGEPSQGTGRDAGLPAGFTTFPPLPERLQSHYGDGGNNESDQLQRKKILKKINAGAKQNETLSCTHRRRDGGVQGGRGKKGDAEGTTPGTRREKQS